MSARARGAVLVTGGAGFIGSHVADALVARGERVVVADDLSTGRRENVPAGATFLQGDLAEPGIAARALQGCDRVVHCAARASVALSVEDPLASHRANLEASTRLLLAARDARVRRLVYSGTSAAYGGVAGGRPAQETRREAPLSPYGVNKLAAEQLFRLAPGLYGLDTLCLRYFNVYGPRQDPRSPYSGVIALFATTALAGQPATIHGDGLQSRDFTYVADVVRANLLALDLARGRGRVVNVGAGVSLTILDLWRAVAAAAGVPGLEVLHAPARAGDVRHSLAAVERARRILGFAAETSLVEGLARTIAWYRSPPS